MLDQEDKLFLAECFKFLALAKTETTWPQIEELFNKRLSKEYYDQTADTICRLTSINSELIKQVNEARTFANLIRANNNIEMRFPWEK
jgi:hypothetical protein